jgi:N-acetylneuraminic acid mutarotase
MKKLFLSVALLMVSILISCNKDEPSPEVESPVIYSYAAIPDFTGIARDGAIAFSIGDSGYVGLGEKYPTLYKDFYKYNTVTNQWSPIADFGGIARRGAIAFVLGNTAYVGTGYGDSGGSTFTTFKDMWKYDAFTNTWTQLNDFPISTDDATTFVINSKAYVITSNKSVYEYNPTDDSWTAKKAFSGVGREDAVAFTIGSKGYLGTGYDGSERLKDFWEYNPTNDSWTKKADFPGTPVSNAVGFSLGNYGFLGTGNDYVSNYDDFYRYDPSNNSWSDVTSYEAGDGYGIVSFVVNNKAYLGNGYTSNYSAKFYKFQ